MVKVVTTIPVSPVHSTQLGFYSLFAYANKLAAERNLRVVYSINTLGKGCVGREMSLLETTIETLALAPSLWWNDSVLQATQIQHVIEDLYERGIVSVQQRDIACCKCGKVEYLASVQLHGGRKALVRNGRAQCCGTDVVVTPQKVLLSAPLSIAVEPQVFPDWAQKESSEVFGKFRGERFLLSRNTPRDFAVMLDDGVFWLDMDVVWWLHLHWLTQLGVEVRHLITGASTLLHACKVVLFGSLLNIHVPKTIHVLPKVLFEPVCGIETTSLAVERFGTKRVINALLWSALSPRKKITLKGTLFPQMVDSVPNIPLRQVRKHLMKTG